MKNNIIKNFTVLIASLIISGSAFAWTPTKNVTMIVPFPPGSGNDLIARTLSEYVSRTTGVNIVIENKAGAGGTVGMTYLTRLPNDGYNVALASIGGISGIDHTLPNFYQNPPYDVGSFSYALKVGFSPVVIIANVDDPVSNPRQLINVLEKEKVDIGHSGGGGRLGLESILLAVNANNNKNLNRIEHRGPSQTAIDVAGKHVRFGAIPLAVAVTFKDANKIKIVTHTAKDKIKTLPNVQSFSTVVPNFNATVDWGVVLPKDTPKEILDWYAIEFSRALNDEKIKEFFDKNFFFVSESSLRNPKTFESWVVEQRNKNTPIVNEVIRLMKSENK
jgi:tripartite-type tricarboxylate transporter receptor subunit TctC